MDQNSHYQQLANDIMDMWQKHLAGMMGDKRFLQMMMDMMDYAQRMQRHDPAGTTKQSTNRHTSDAVDDDDGLLAELSFRLAMCEKRLATVEKQLADTKKPVRKTAAKRKPAAKRPAGRGKTTRK